MCVAERGSVFSAQHTMMHTHHTARCPLSRNACIRYAGCRLPKTWSPSDCMSRDAMQSCMHVGVCRCRRENRRRPHQCVRCADLSDVYPCMCSSHRRVPHVHLPMYLVCASLSRSLHSSLLLLRPPRMSRYWCHSCSAIIVPIFSAAGDALKCSTCGNEVTSTWQREQRRNRCDAMRCDAMRCGSHTRLSLSLFVFVRLVVVC